LFEYHGLKISWLGHDTFKIKNAKTVYTDPYEIRSGEEADILLVSHDHFDHCSPRDAQKVCSDKTTIVTTAASKRLLSKLKVKEIIVAKPGEKILIDSVSIETVPSYNVNKFKAPSEEFHPKKDQMLGFILTMNGARIYHAGDTDLIPEMSRLNVDVALLPVSGTYTMTAEEAAKATKSIKTKIAIPMHHGTVVGDEQDAERFKKLAACEVQILSKE
jgi:L-ascorbate metabolism protein UlaG (beta-lactamase superfamily)